MTSRAGSQFTLNFTLQWSSHAPSAVQRVLAFSKIAILWRLLQHHTSDNNEMVGELDIDVKGLSATMCSLWASWTESFEKKRGPMRTFWVHLLAIIYFLRDSEKFWPQNYFSVTVTMVRWMTRCSRMVSLRHWQKPIALHRWLNILAVHSRFLILSINLTLTVCLLCLCLHF